MADKKTRANGSKAETKTRGASEKAASGTARKTTGGTREYKATSAIGSSASGRASNGNAKTAAGDVTRANEGEFLNGVVVKILLNLKKVKLDLNSKIVKFDVIENLKDLKKMIF